MTCFVLQICSFIILTISTLSFVDGRFYILVSYCEERNYCTLIQAELVATGMGKLESIKTWSLPAPARPLAYPPAMASSLVPASPLARPPVPADPLALPSWATPLP
jgi:hypothetical protein